jgi:general secretion pathway protein G
MISLAIIGILVSVAAPIAQVAMQREKENDLRRALREIRTGIDAYKQSFEDGRIQRSPQDSGYPKSLAVLVDGVEDAKSPERRKIYFMRRVPRDPLAADSGQAAEQTWGKRSYASPAESPAEGDDIFDVYSRSGAVGINQVPYRLW